MVPTGAVGSGKAGAGAGGRVWRLTSGGGRYQAGGPRGGRREEADAAVSEKGERVEVGATASQAPVQARRGRAAGMARFEVAQLVAGADDGTRRDSRCDRLVCGEQAVRVLDADDAHAGDDPGEVDDPCPGGQDRLGGGAGEVHAAVAGEPRGRRGLEAAGDRRGGGEWPLVPDGWSRRVHGWERHRAGDPLGARSVVPVPERVSGRDPGSVGWDPGSRWRPEEKKCEQGAEHGHAPRVTVGVTAGRSPVDNHPACGQQGPGHSRNRAGPARTGAGPQPLTSTGNASASRSYSAAVLYTCADSRRIPPPPQ